MVLASILGPMAVIIKASFKTESDKVKVNGFILMALSIRANLKTTSNKDMANKPINQANTSKVFS